MPLESYFLETTSMPLLLLSMRRQPQDMLLWEVLRNLTSSIVFEGFTDSQNEYLRGFFIYQLNIHNSKVRKQ